jgi:DNA-binding response OmpR family regulator
MSVKILYVEDDKTLAFLTKDSLEDHGFEVRHEEDGELAFKAFKTQEFDICLIDVMMPKKDGFTLAQDIRKLNTHIPIIFLTAKSLLQDKMKGFDIGGDDYITKPYSMEELAMKIKVFLKRKVIVEAKESISKIGEYTFDFHNLILTHSDEQINLTLKEASLLRLLIEQDGNIIKREMILELIWGKNDYFLGRSMDVFISRLRKYLRHDAKIQLENIHGIGFRLSF